MVRRCQPLLNIVRRTKNVKPYQPEITVVDFGWLPISWNGLIKARTRFVIFASLQRDYQKLPHCLSTTAKNRLQLWKALKNQIASHHAFDKSLEQL